jgi:hypothetical protein
MTYDQKDKKERIAALTQRSVTPLGIRGLQLLPVLKVTLLTPSVETITDSMPFSRVEHPAS